jgi:prepilin-type N-terminal cleavage/methylation domain-containing protein
MRMPKRGEKGFTLIELLIVVAILGVLAAIVIPNVSRFLGRGETEAQKTEFANIQSAVLSMMTDNHIATLPTPVSADADRTADMHAFPDNTPATSKGVDSLGNTYDTGDGDGFVLYQHDRIADVGTGNLTNYVATRYTSFWYTVDIQGTVTQFDSAAP